MDMKLTISQKLLPTPSQAQFLCVSCGHAGLPDSIAAENIRGAAINRPIVDNAFGVELQTPLLATG